MSRLEAIKLRMGIIQAPFPDGMNLWFTMNDREFTDRLAYGNISSTVYWKDTFSSDNADFSWKEYSIQSFPTKKQTIREGPNGERTLSLTFQYDEV